MPFYPQYNQAPPHIYTHRKHRHITVLGALGQLLGFCGCRNLRRCRPSPTSSTPCDCDDQRRRSSAPGSSSLQLTISYNTAAVTARRETLQRAVRLAGLPWAGLAAAPPHFAVPQCTPPHPPSPHPFPPSSTTPTLPTQPPRTMNVVREIQRLNEKELQRGTASTEGSWHDQYKDSAWVFVGSLPLQLSEGDVLCVMSQWGEIEDLHLVRDKGTGKSKGFAFVKYEDQRSTVLAVDNFNGVKLLDRTLRVDHKEKYALPKEVLEKEEEKEKARMEDRKSVV